MKKIVLFVAVLLSICVNAQNKPNIVMIIVDDFGYNDIGFHGSEIYQTPAIDNLATEGIVFKNGYSSYPRCTPSRYAMFSGTYPVNENKGYLGGMKPSQNFIQQFKNEGYSMSYVGKWHVGGEESSPKGLGFNHSFAAGDAGGVDTRFYPFNTKSLESKKNEKGHKAPVLDVKEVGKEGDYLSDVLTDATLNFIDNSTKDQPFFAVLSYYAVHTPIEAKPADEARNQAEIDAFNYGDGPAYIKEGTGRRKMRQDDAGYAGMVENVDENIGRVMALLDEKELRENTIVVVLSDHGGLSNDGFKGERHLATTNLPFKAGKGWLYEGGIRIPYIINWKGSLTPNFNKESIVLGMDILPTLLDLTSNKKVENIDGESFKNVLIGNEKWNDRTVFWHSKKARPHSTGDSPVSAIRSGDFKLVHFLEDDRVELYNVVLDEGELNDLSVSNPKKTQELKQILDDWKSAYLIPSKLKRLKHQVKQ